MPYIRRLLPERVPNMRELGGYPAAGGGMTQWGRFIRSDVPLELTDADTAALYGYGVRTVIDMRTAEETVWKPSALARAEGFDFHNIPFTDDFTYLGHPLYCPLEHLVPVIEGVHRVKEILTRLAYAEGAALFFCYAGKDRTGMIAALLLMTAGVDEDDIAADYQVTYTYVRKKLAGLHSDLNRPESLKQEDTDGIRRPEHLRRTEPEWIMPFLAHVQSFGGAEGFLRHIGLDGGDIAALRKRLLN